MTRESVFDSWQGQRHVSSAPDPVRLWSLPSLLSQKIKGLGKLNTRLHFVLRLRICEAVPQLPHSPQSSSWHALLKKFRDSLIFYVTLLNMGLRGVCRPCTAGRFKISHFQVIRVLEDYEILHDCFVGIWGRGRWPCQDSCSC
jgi:hypothetical protein